MARTKRSESNDCSDPNCRQVDPPDPPELGLTVKDARSDLDRVAGVLHDEILQAFATCLLKAQLCERLLQLERYDMVRNELPLLQDTLSDAIDQVRALAATLKKPVSETSAL